MGETQTGDALPDGVPLGRLEGGPDAEGEAEETTLIGTISVPARTECRLERTIFVPDHGTMPSARSEV